MAERAWSNEEIDLIIEDYFSMLNKELRNNAYNKTQHRNLLKEQLNRSDGSIEYKHQNISAVLMKLGLPFIRGYKPAWNYQLMLMEKVVAYLSTQKSFLEPLFLEFADRSTTVEETIQDFKNIVDEPPETKNQVAEPQISYRRKPIKTNYILREQNNSALGENGERFVLNYEKWRLIQADKASLADQIEWISPQDDGAGFDILSKNLDGTDRYIEVKTTKLGKYTPIFFSYNEYAFSKANASEYYLYRLYNFDTLPKMFSLAGDFDSFCTKEPIHFRGYF